MNAVRPNDADVASSPLVITPMRRRHLRQVLRIDHAVYTRPWSLGLYLGEIARPEGRSYLVARRGGQVVGYAGVMAILEDAHITTVAVDPDHQRTGVAGRLMVTLLRRAVELGAERATLEVRVSNAGAQALYSRFGFAPAGARRAYYVDNREDALVMWCHDIHTSTYVERLSGIEERLPGRAVVEGPPPS